MKPVQVISLQYKFAEGDAADTGKFVGYGSVYGNIDHAGDIMAAGCFKKSISDRKSSGGKFPILWQHDAREPIGVIDEIKEDSNGLQISVSLNLDTTKGREAYSLMKQRAVTGLSVGFQVVNQRYDKHGIRTITEAKLHEVSVVTFPCNSAATISAIKSAYDNASTETIEIEAVLDTIEKASLPNSISTTDFSLLVGELRSLVKSAREDDDLERELAEALAVTNADDGKTEEADQLNDDEPLDEEELMKSLSTLLHSIKSKD